MKCIEGEFFWYTMIALNVKLGSIEAGLHMLPVTNMFHIRITRQMCLTFILSCGKRPGVERLDKSRTSNLYGLGYMIGLKQNNYATYNS